MYDLHAPMTILMSCSILFSTKVAPSRSDTRTFLRCFTEGSRKSHGSLTEVSRKVPGSLTEVSRKSHGRFQEHFRNLSRNYLDPGSFLEYGMFPGRFQECSRKVPGTIWIQEDSRKQETGNRKKIHKDPSQINIRSYSTEYGRMIETPHYSRGQQASCHLSKDSFCYLRYLLI